MPSTYIVDPILPVHEVHLIGGPSGVGKTTWLLQTLNHVSLGSPILDYPTARTEWTYVSCDRSGAGMDRTLDRVGLPLNRASFHSRREIRSGALADIDHIMSWCPTPLLIVEAFSLLMPSSRTGDATHRYQDVGAWLSHVGDLCARHGITILATVHSPKSRENERYANPRERVLGSVAFAALVETIFLIERERVDDVDNQVRIVHVLPRNAPEKVVRYSLDAGGRFCPLPDAGEALSSFVLDQVLAAYPFGEVIPAAELVGSATAKGISRPTVYRLLDTRIEAGTLERSGRGCYVKPHRN